MQKALVTIKGLGITTSILSVVYLVSRAQRAYPDFYSWVGGVLIVFAIMYAGALITRGTTRD